MLSLRKLFRRGQNELPSRPEPIVAPGSAFESLFGGQSPAVGQPIAKRVNVVVVGNCLSEEIVKGLSAALNGNEVYRFAAIPLHLTPITSPECQQMLAVADYVFIQQMGRQDISTIPAHIKPGCVIVYYPDVVLRSPWPFDSVNGYPDDVAQSFPEGAIRHFDGGLARMRTLVPDKKKRFASYRELDFDWAPKIATIAETQRRFLDSIDTLNDVHLGRFIWENFAHRQLFYNSTHPSGILFYKLCAYCWRTLGLPGVMPHVNCLDSWKAWSVPVHPRIAQSLGLKWADENTLYTYCTIGNVTWADWVGLYIDTFG